VLRVGDGGVLQAQGEINIEHGGSLIGTATSRLTKIVIKPGMGATCKLNLSNTAGTGAAIVNLSGASNSAPFEIVGDMSGGGMAMMIPTPGGGVMPVWTLRNVVIQNCGTASITCGNGYPWNSSGTFSMTNALFLNDGGIDITFPADGTSSILINGVSLVAPKAITNLGRWVETGAITTATRYVKNVTAYVDPTFTITNPSFPALTVSIKGGKCGFEIARGDATDEPCFQGYNTSMLLNTSAAADAGIVLTGAWIIADGQKSKLAEGNLFAGEAADGMVFQDSIAYMHWANPHQWVGATNGGGTPNRYIGNICDGDGFNAPGDTGNMIEDNGNHLTQFNLDLNACGQIDADQGPSQGFNVLNNTIAGSWGVSLGNSNVQYSPMVIKRNLFWLPFDPSGSGQPTFDNGLTVQSADLSQNATHWPDYNGYYLMPGSGDSDDGYTAPDCGSTAPCNLPNATNDTTVSYVGVPAISRVPSSVSTAVSGTSVTCSRCNFRLSAVRVGDYLVDESGPIKPYAQVTSVNSPTNLTIAETISGFVTGDTFSIRPSYWSTAGVVYGTTSGYGTHDIHASPHFVDPTRNNCNYLVRVLGGRANCNWYFSAGGQGNVFTSTSVSGTAIINDMHTNFLTIGITGGVDVVQIYVGATGTTTRCIEPVTAVSATQITFHSCPGLTSGDRFTFITATQLLARKIVTLNGWDYQGHPTAPIANANVYQALRWIRAGWAPQNPIYWGAGDDGSDFGAIQHVSGHPGDAQGLEE
jgi:hypothetical protein